MLAALVAVCLLLGLLGGLELARGARGREMHRSRRRGLKGAARALRLLRRAGYRIEQREITTTVCALVDGRPEEFRVRADVVVSHRRRIYIAEIKAGPDSASLANRFTRRQLLEYSHAFREADGLLLVDAHRGRIQRVEFPGWPLAGKQ